MKHMKKLTALFLALVMVLALSTGILAAGPKYSSWFKDSYADMQHSEYAIIPSSLANADLTKTITRGEMSEIAVIAFELATGNKIDELERTDYFTDTTDTNILKAYEYGIVSGYPDGTFLPNKPLTRQEFFKIIQNFCKAAAYSANYTDAKQLNSFADSGLVDSWAREAAQLCVENSFVTGTKTGSSYYLYPNSVTTRQEALAMFLRAVKGVKQWYYFNVTTASIEVNTDEIDVTVETYNATMYTTTAVNARDRWTKESPSYGVLAIYTAVTVTGKCSNGWYQVKYNGHTAYIAGDYLSTESGGHSVGGGSTSGGTSSGSGTATDIANFAMSFVGYSYVWGGMSPSTGFDCSGLMYYVLTQYGYSMKRVANDQMTQGTAISRDNLQVGDLVFFGYGSYANHVGMYIGNGNFVHASTPSTGVRVNSLNETYYNTRYIGARRII